MANNEHVQVLLGGSDAIAEWCKENPDTKLDLREAELRRADLTYANLSHTDLTGANLEWGDLRWADLIGADLKRTNLKRADFHKADLHGANLREADLTLANLEDANLVDAIIDKAVFDRTRFNNTDLSTVIGADGAIHNGPSEIDGETIAKSEGLSVKFLQGCGLFAAYNAVVFRVVVGSPGDVAEERKLARDIIYSWNDHNAHRYNAVLLPVLWETHAVPELGDRPQAIINRQLIQTSQILIGIFWTRLGTPTDAAESGTAEEIYEFGKANKPVLTYFCSRPISQTTDMDQFSALQEFKSKIKKEGLIAEFGTEQELRDLLSKHLTAVVEKLLH